MIRVLVVEDQQLFKDGVKALLAQEDDIEVIGLACNGEEAIRQIKDQQPDVVLMDIHMPQVDGIKATLYIKEHYPDIKVVLLTTYAQKDAVIMGLNAGADGFLLKSLDAERLIRTIRDAYSGQIVISGEAAKILAGAALRLQCSKKDVLEQRLIGHNIHLSKRELDIAYLLMKGTSNQRIAQTLFLSEGTVKNYISTIYGKLNVATRKEAVAFLDDLSGSEDG